MIGELHAELRRLLRGLNGQTGIFLGCFGVLAAQLFWLSLKGVLPAPSALPLFTALGATLAAHSYFLAQRGLLVWIHAVDLRLGPGSGVALLEAAAMPEKGEAAEPGIGPGAGEFKPSKEAALPGILRRGRKLSWMAPLLLAFSAAVFSLHGLSGAALACGAGAFLSSLEALSLQGLMKEAY